MGEFVDLKTAAEYLGLARRTVREMGERGDIPMFRIGPNRGRFRFRMDDLRAHVESGLVIPPAPVARPTTATRYSGRTDGKPLRRF